MRGSTPGSTPPASRLFGGLVVVPGFQMTLLDCLRPANPRPSGGICLSSRPAVRLVSPQRSPFNPPRPLHVLLSLPLRHHVRNLVSPPPAPALVLLTASSRTSTPVTSTTGVFQHRRDSSPVAPPLAPRLSTCFFSILPSPWSIISSSLLQESSRPWSCCLLPPDETPAVHLRPGTEGLLTSHGP